MSGPRFGGTRGVSVAMCPRPLPFVVSLPCLPCTLHCLPFRCVALRCVAESFQACLQLPFPILPPLPLSFLLDPSLASEPSHLNPPPVVLLLALPCPAICCTHYTSLSHALLGLPCLAPLMAGCRRRESERERESE